MNNIKMGVESNYAMPKEAENYLKDHEPDTIVIMAFKDGKLIGAHLREIKDVSYRAYIGYSEDGGVIIKTAERKK
jgi:hypothetical protein